MLKASVNKQGGDTIWISRAISLPNRHPEAMRRYILSANTSFGGFGKGPMSLILKGVVKKMDKDYKNNGNIKWNFTKFLIDREGNIAARFEPTDAIDRVKEKVEEIL